ncbi:uncharacterized protein LOC132277792 [Cornus florida]|uniref:uncharacterized protein LOC132277792 n=1 Tax=Cornus florida TaxID=4283 RepID=UPI0028A1FDB4|nr:uncharacterized protein LOC132277792 [Cornus florida]
MECHPSTAVQAFKLAMNRGTPIHTSLVVNTPKTMDELNERADSFVRLEEEETTNARKTSIISTEEKSKAKIRQKQAPQCQTSWKELKEASGDDDRKGRIYKICSRASARPESTSLARFDGKRVEPIGTVELLVQAAERELFESFVVMEIYPSYNLPMGKGWIHRVQGVPSTLHQVMRCLSPDRNKVIDIYGDQKPPPSTNGEEEPPVLTEEPLADVQINHLRPDRTTKIGSGLGKEEKRQLIDFFSQNVDVFASSHSDMPGIDLSVSCHSLHVYPNVKPVRQKQRRFAPERNQIIADEVDRFLEAGFIREVQYPIWLSNVVVVQKMNRKWKVCIDFTNLNKVCPKDSFPLPKIDQMVDVTTGYEQLTFLDAYSGYNQIPMDPNDEEKTSFVTERGTYYYKNQMDKTVEAYIDDMAVKSK